MSNNKLGFTKYNNVDVQELEFEISTHKNQKQLIAFPRYKDDEKLYVILPNIHLDCYGVPNNKSEYYTTPESREFIKLPISDTKLQKFFESVDDKFSNKGYLNYLLGNKGKSYKYQNSLKIPDPESKYQTPFVKLKLSKQYPENTINTSVFHNESGKSIYKDCNDIDTFCKLVMYNSKVKCIITPCKMWFSPGTETCGITYKLVKILVDPPEIKEVAKLEINDDGLLDLDSDSD